MQIPFKKNSTRRFQKEFLNPAIVADIVKYLIVITAAIWVLKSGSNKLGYNWQWYRVLPFLFTWAEGRFTAGPLLKGLWVTLKISGISLVLSFIFGLTAALLRLSDSLLGWLAARIYLELIRNTPLLIQLFFIYFVIGPILEIDRFTSAILALSLFEGAYASEILRAGILSISKGQWEAAYSLGLKKNAAFRLIILPQAIRQILPPLTNQAVSLIKDSALVSTIAIYDLTMQGQAIIAETFLTFELWFTIAAIYLTVTLFISILAHLLETYLHVYT